MMSLSEWEAELKCSATDFYTDEGLCPKRLYIF